MSFMFLPTAAVLMVLFFWFFSISKFVDFITSQDTFASIIRIVMMALEIACVYHMYKYYENEELAAEAKKSVDGVLKDPDAALEDCKSVGVERSSCIRDIFYSSAYDDKFQVWATENPRIKIIKHIPKSSS